MTRKLIPYAGAEPSKPRPKPRPLKVKDDRVYSMLEVVILGELEHCQKKLAELEEKKDRLTKRLIEVQRQNKKEGK